ncbi:MAG TPA: pyridoxamine 5'-phosphate oxidase family protein [Nocardioidaceae bacterium]|nr:pyridoxamine 5'-phosphate oxidase family protein [Nocardioidaceae bacterium]
MSGIPIELSLEECLQRLACHSVGRLALSTQHGPRIIPVNYALHGEAIVVRTSPYSELGAYGDNRQVAFEIDHFDEDRQLGWSVVAHGLAHRIGDPEEVRRIRLAWDPTPWAEGVRSLYLRVDWHTLTGRRLADRHPLAHAPDQQMA